MPNAVFVAIAAAFLPARNKRTAVLAALSLVRLLSQIPLPVGTPPSPALETARFQVTADDVSRMSLTPIRRVFHPRTMADVVRVVREANQRGVPVSARGTSHSMGGQSIAADGFLVDMKHMDEITVHPEQATADVGPAPPGASYCSFAVGGTVSVNAHGVTSDEAMHASIVSMKVVNADGDLIVVDRDGPHADLFGHVIGGYGLFGIIVQVRIRLQANVRLSMRVHSFTGGDEFMAFYTRTTLNDPEVNVKLARLDLLQSGDDSPIKLYSFMRRTPTSTVSDIALRGRQMTDASKFLYKWIAPTPFGRRMRTTVETLTGTPADWNLDTAGERNSLLYESADPLAKLYTWVVHVDDTFVLQEYFLAFDQAAAWIRLARRILQRWAKRKNAPRLLNCTIRTVRNDTCTALPYASGRDRIAFVLYYRLQKPYENMLAEIHNELVEATLSLQGTFYLPYRLHYTDDQVRRAYPRIGAFLAKKQQYDPRGIFSNAFWEKHRHMADAVAFPSPMAFVPEQQVPGWEPADVTVTRRDPTRSSLATVIRDPVLAHAFKEHFLVSVFRLENPDALFDVVCKALDDCPDNTDACVYVRIQERLRQRPWQAVLGAGYAYRGWRQIVRQRGEWVDEASSIISDLRGSVPAIDGLASIGDPGRTVKALAGRLRISGNRYVIHDARRGLTDVLERNSLGDVGEFVQWSPDVGTVDVPDASVDLVTVFTGLHHIPLDRLSVVLDEVYRILRPGGIFLVREHDCTDALVPMVEVAHTVFNAVTGVPITDEVDEIRHFRTVSEWRALITSHHFLDAMLFSVQDFDPTVDVMMTFAKAPWMSPPAPPVRYQAPGLVPVPSAYDASTSAYCVPEWQIVDLAKRFSMSLDRTPWFRFPFIGSMRDVWRSFWHSTRSVAEREGMPRALTSNGFAVSAVITVAYSAFAVQAAALALPLQMMFPDDVYPLVKIEIESDDGLANLNGDLGHHSAVVKRNEVNGNVARSMIECEQHVPFTKVLLRLAAGSPTTVLVSVDGLTAAAGTRLSLLMTGAAGVVSEAELEGSVPGAHVVWARRPAVDTSKLHASVEVPMGVLLDFLRMYPEAEPGHDDDLWRTVQVYGFYE
ncbi:hypothetical protein PBRA_005178 [Plasmodiophora brassicae]|uniref:FAD-binding PCMH-type domain-containing protein n=1 Tax=Plasmodiophora brassicae TaxID=37360 RepID=A0A0G4IN02_PLABS|nr:hypothetical protein PBRA_005178 [Plasmodiophora brassicae]